MRPAIFGANINNKGYFCPKIQTARARAVRLNILKLLARLQQHNKDKKASEQQANKQQDLVPVVVGSR